ncbi:MAG: FtsX-like permease family protein [Acidobacteria bacterium]|nr:FtsX-like permease family protein [Acidobacteriota bacterium]
MSLWSRFVNVFRGDSLRREIAEELESHIEEAVERGRDPLEARRALGPALRLREESRDVRLLSWLDSLRGDAVFAWRQIVKNTAATAAVILSLGLAIGSCLAAFRLVDALLLRPLPIAHVERLHSVAHEGFNDRHELQASQSFEYPLFREMRAAVEADAELLALSYAQRADLAFGAGEETEKAYRQFVLGGMFDSFGLMPALGRLLTAADDATPGGHPYAVLSYDFWNRRFGRDPEIVGQTFRMDDQVFEIIGVLEQGFTGVEPGVFVDVYAPLTMNGALSRPGLGWIRAFALLGPDASANAVRDKLTPIYRAYQEEQVKDWKAAKQEVVDRWLNRTLRVEPAPTGSSEIQRTYRTGLTAIAGLAALVLLIACANVANLMSARAATRSREMALRVSIGAGRRRLVRLVLVESAFLALLATAVGAAFCSWAAPQVVGMISPPDNPTRLTLPADLRLFGFGMALSVAVTGLFGVAPALRASSVQPVAALKGGEAPRLRQRLMKGLVGVQAAFCVVVTLMAGLLVGTLDRLRNQDMGFSAPGLLLLEASSDTPQPSSAWRQAIDGLAATPGVESASAASWPLLFGISGGLVWTDGRPAEASSYLLRVSPGWAETMQIGRVEGRDLRVGETDGALVNEAFAETFLGKASPLGRWFEIGSPNGSRSRFQVVGVVHDAVYHDLREGFRPAAYIPFHAGDGGESPQSWGTFVVRTKGEAASALAPALREAVSRARPEFRVTNVRTQQELISRQTVRERLLAALASFFAVVALLLAGLGLYGVLEYSVFQRRREIGVRRAVGAQAGDIAWQVTASVGATAAVGALIGVGLSLLAARSIESLLYQVRPTDAAMLAPAALAVGLAAVAAAAPSVAKAVGIDPAEILRAD